MSITVRAGKAWINEYFYLNTADFNITEIALADIHVGAGVVKLTQSNVTDQRLDNNLCGMVAGVVTQIDTTAFNAQRQATGQE